jgi:uncharacterized protein (DUF58 family)
MVLGASELALLDQLKDSMVQLAFVLGAAFLLGRFVKARPSAYTLGLMLLPVPLLAFSVWWPVLATVAIVYTPLLMLLLMVDGFLLSVPARYISLSRSLGRKFSIGQKNQVILTVMNNSGRPIVGMVRDSVPQGLMAGQTPTSITLPASVLPYSYQTLSYELFPTHRGLYRLEKIHFRYRSKLGLLWLAIKGGRPDKIKVTPDLRRVRKMRLMASRAQNAGELQKRALGMEGTQFSGLRHYFAGDDIRKIAWQATARQDIPVVRTFTHEVEQPILVLLDAGRKMDVRVNQLQKYDWALNTALAFMGVAIDRGDAVGAGTFSNRILSSIPLKTGRRHLNRLLDLLGETEVQPVEPDYEAVMLQFARGLKRRSLVVIFTDLIDPLASRSLLASLRSFSRNHMLMVVTLADSQTIAKAEMLPETPYEAYQKGVALDLLALRRETQMALSKNKKAIIIDAPPDKLDETLIARYLELKRQNRL